MPALADKPVYSVQELAHLLGVHYTTVARMVGDGRIRGQRIGRLWRIPASEVERLTNVPEISN